MVLSKFYGQEVIENEGCPPWHNLGRADRKNSEDCG